MYKTIDFYDFENAFEAMGRGNQFTPAGLRVLFDYLEESEAGRDIELDVIAFCCDYREDTVANLAAEHDIMPDHDRREAKLKEAVLDYLNARTTVCGATDDTIVYAVF